MGKNSALNDLFEKWCDDYRSMSIDTSKFSYDGIISRSQSFTLRPETQCRRMPWWQAMKACLRVNH